MARRHREILDALLERIADGALAPGTMLPKEELIAEEFGVSRGTGREALRALEERRVAVVKHGRGATVQPPEEWNVLDAAVGGVLARSKRRKRFLAEVHELRAALEVLAAGLAAERASAAERERLRAAAAAGELGGVSRLVAVAARNRPLAATLRALADLSRPGLDEASARRLAAAVADGDAEAARAAAGG